MTAKSICVHEWDATSREIYKFDSIKEANETLNITLRPITSPFHAAKNNISWYKAHPQDIDCPKGWVKQDG